jgi:hypothetical protein
MKLKVGVIGIFLSLLYGGKAKIAFLHHANQHFSDHGEYALLPGDPGYIGNSYHRTLDTHFYYEVPIDIHVSGPLIQSYRWLQNDNGLLDRLKNSDLVFMVGGAYAENILPYAAIEMNSFSLSYKKFIDSSLIKPVGWENYPNVIWIPERVWKSEDLMPYSLIEILNNTYGKWGYTSEGEWVWMPPCIVLDENVHGWYYHTFPSGWPCDNPFKVHRMYDYSGNYVFVVFISEAARNNMVWNDISDPGNPLHQLLSSLSNSWDQWQIVVYGDDWEKAAGVAGWDFGQPGAPANSYDWNISWIKSQESWIMPIHICEAVKWWGIDVLYNDDPLDDPPIIDIDYAAYPELHGWTGGNYDNWYNVFKVTQGWGTSLGPDENGNGVQGDYEDLWQFGWHRLMEVPMNRVSKMGWVTLMGLLYETAWHSGGELAYWGKPLWNHSRYAGGFAFGGKWLDSLRFLGGAHIRVEDLDGDGYDEYALFNGEICAIFDRRGGRALWFFNKDGDVIIGNLMTGWGGEGDYDDGGHTGLFEDSQAENSWFDATVDTSVIDTAKLYLQEVYDWQGNTSTDVEKIIVITSGKSYLEARYYSVWENWIKAGVTPDLEDILGNGYGLTFIQGISDSGWTYAGYENTRSGAKGVFLWASGQGFTYNNLGKMSSGAEKIEIGGRSGSFTIYFYGGRGEPEVDKPGPGDLEGPIITGTSQTPYPNVPPFQDVLITSWITDPSGIEYAGIHYGIDGNWNNPDIIMVPDDGNNYDWDGDGEPDPDLFGGYIPGQPFWTLVEYAIHAIDSAGRESWDNNYGENYSYRVGFVSIIIDGELDSIAVLLSENGGMHLWGYYDQDSGKLYIATEAAGDGGLGFQNDHFIFISLSPTELRPAPWNKSGYVANWNLFLADENDNSFAGFFDSSGIYIGSSPFLQCSSGPSVEYVLEGLIDLDGYFGFLPETLYIAVGSYETDDGGTLQWQVPMPQVQDGNLDPEEFLPIDLETLIKEGFIGTPSLRLSAPYPNPTKGKVQVTLEIPVASNVIVELYDVAGRRIRTIYKGKLERGIWDFKWNGRDMMGREVGGGVYFLRVLVDNRSITRKIVKIGR